MLDFKVSLVLPSGASLMVIPDASGFMKVQFIAADGSTIVDSESITQAAASKFLRELQDVHQARTVELQS